MVSVFDLAVAMNESNHSGGSNFMPMDIPDSFGLIESIQYANNEIMEEAAAFDSYSLSVDEILFEAVAVRSPNVGIITESVFSSLVEQVKKFFGKVIGAIKAIIGKIKSFFTKVETKSVAWTEKYRNRLANSSGNAAVSVTMYNWNLDMVKTGLMDTAKKVADMATSKGVEGALAELKKAMSSVPLSSIGGDKLTDEQKKNWENNIAHQIEVAKDESDKAKQEIVSAVGVNASSIDGIWSLLETRVHGGESQSEKKVGFSEAKAMFSFIEDAGKLGANHTKIYSDYLRRVESAQNEWDKTLQDYVKGLGNENKSVPESYMNKYTELARIRAKEMMSVVSTGQSVVSGISSRNVAYLQGCTSDYMKAVAAFVAETPAKGHTVIDKE